MSKVKVQLFIPCFVDQLYPETGFSMVKVLEKLGCEVQYLQSQTCCGQPAYNAGYFQESCDVACKFVTDFTATEGYIVAPSASCVGMLRNSYEYFLKDGYFNKRGISADTFHAFAKRVYEFSEFLTQVLGVSQVPGAKFNGVATYHDSCSALRECGIKQGPRALLNGVEGLELVEMNECETCCGFGGTFAVKFEPISVGMAAQKVDNAIETGARYIISTDSSCLLHIDGYIRKKGLAIKTMHLADVLASGL